MVHQPQLPELDAAIPSRKAERSAAPNRGWVDRGDGSPGTVWLTRGSKRAEEGGGVAPHAQVSLEHLSGWVLIADARHVRRQLRPRSTSTFDGHNLTSATPLRQDLCRHRLRRQVVGSVGRRSWSGRFHTVEVAVLVG